MCISDSDPTLVQEQDDYFGVTFGHLKREKHFEGRLELLGKQAYQVQLVQNSDTLGTKFLISNLLLQECLKLIIILDSILIASLHFDA